MKKIMMTTVLLLTVVMGLQAQSLIGTWKTVSETDEDGDNYTWIFTFTQSNSLDMKMSMVSSDPEVGDFEFTMAFPGTYQRNGNALSFNFDTEKATMTIDKVKFTGEIADLIKESPEMEQTIKDLLQKQVDQEIKKNLGSGSPFGKEEVTIKELTVRNLILESGDTVLEFFKQ